MKTLIRSNCFHISILSLCAIAVLLLFNGTGQEADSINHYLYARYAMVHPELYLNHWAKPLFTFIASPFAQFGFYGLKAFNVACSLATAGILISIAKKLNFKSPYLAAYFFFLMPLTYLVSFSGLTEPLCALILVYSIYLTLNKQLTWALILISFTPFVRSEGLILLAVFACYLFAVNQLKKLPLLAVGHLVFSLAGFFYYRDLLWVFTKIPYAHLASPYGSGNLFHFPEQLIYVTGVPMLVIFLLGTVLILIRSFTRKTPVLSILILLGFFLFFISHALFWYFGIFNSMGLKRVLGSVSPLIALISLYGWNYIGEVISYKKLGQGLQLSLLIYLLVFPFTSNPAAVDWKKDLNLSPPQLMAIQIAEKTPQTANTKRILYADPYLSEALEIDPFNPELHQFLSKEALNKIKKGDLVIWENWHAPTDSGIELSDLTDIPGLTEIVKLENYENSRAVIYVLFEKAD